VLREGPPGNFTLESTRGRHFLFAALLVVTALVGGILCYDRLDLECSRVEDRCTFRSTGVLQGGFKGQAKLSEIDFLSADGTTTRSSQHRTFTRMRHVFVLKDQRRIPLEPRLRSSLVEDPIHAEFNAFRRGRDTTLSTYAVHFGHIGFFLPTLVAIAGVLVLVAERRSFLFDRNTGRFRIEARGVRFGSSRAEGNLAEIVAIEHVPRGTQIGTYLALLDGRRIRLDVDFQDTFAREMSERFGLPLQVTTSEAILRSGTANSIVPSLLILFLAFLPVILQAGWGAVILVQGLLYR
jgi:hypothetical protein